MLFEPILVTLIYLKPELACLSNLNLSESSIAFKYLGYSTSYQSYAIEFIVVLVWKDMVFKKLFPSLSKLELNEAFTTFCWYLLNADES